MTNPIQNASPQDPTPNNFPDDYDLDEVDPRVRLRTKAVLDKMYGGQTRAAMAQAEEITSVTAGEAKRAATAAVNKSDDTQKRFNDQISSTTNVNEVIDARRPLGATSYPTLGERLNGMDKFLNQYTNPVALGLFTLRNGETNIYDAETEKLQAYVTKNPFGALIFPAGGYYFSTTINFNKPFSMQLSPNTVMSVTDDFNGKVLFNYNCESINDRGTIIVGNGGKINANNNLDSAFHFSNMSTVTVSDLTINDCNGAMILADGNGYGLIVKDVLGQNLLKKVATTDLTHTIGIYCTWSDNTFSNCTFTNVGEGFYLLAEANDLNNCHIWNVDEYVPKSIGFVVDKGGWARFSYCISDTCQIGWKVSRMAYLDHCRIMSNSAYENFMYQNPVAIELTDVDNLLKIHVTNTLFENSFKTLVLEATKDVINPTAETWDKVYSSGNVYFGHVTKKIPEVIEAVGIGNFEPTFYGATVAGNPKYDTRIGQYKRIGNAVFVNIVLQVQLDSTIGGNYLIGGLPFPNGKAMTNLNIGVRASTAGKPLLTSLSGLTFNINPGKNFGELLYNVPNSEVPKNVSNGNLGTDYVMLNINGCYFID